MLALPDVNVKTTNDLSIPDKKSYHTRMGMRCLLDIELKHLLNTTDCTKSHACEAVFSRSILIRLFFSMMFLVLGLCFYIIYRDHTFINIYVNRIIYLRNYIHVCDTLLGGSVPSFIHTISFTLLLSCVVGGARFNDVVICIMWFFVECIFEALPLINAYIPISINLLHSNVIADLCITYVCYGTYDNYDIIAIGLGTGTSAYIMLRTQKEG